jgi:hypothetical protein
MIIDYIRKIIEVQVSRGYRASAKECDFKPKSNAMLPAML